MRFFIAIDILPTKKIQEFLTDLAQNICGVEIKYTEPDNFHITLVFLGETFDHQLKALYNDLKTIEQNSIELVLKGLGVFKDIHHPKSLWIGVEKNEALLKLRRKIHQTTLVHGFKPEE